MPAGTLATARFRGLSCCASRDAAELPPLKGKPQASRRRLRRLLKYWHFGRGADIPVCQDLPVSAAQCPLVADSAG